MPTTNELLKDQIEMNVSPPLQEPVEFPETLNPEEWSKYIEERFAKSQNVRLMDVWIFGPIGIYYALTKCTKWGRFLVFVVGAGTIWYNYQNFVANERWKTELKERGIQWP